MMILDIQRLKLVQILEDIHRVFPVHFVFRVGVGKARIVVVAVLCGRNHTSRQQHSCKQRPRSHRRHGQSGRREQVERVYKVKTDGDDVYS